MSGFFNYNRSLGVLYMNFYLDVNRWWYMILQLIRDSSSLQAIIWGIIGYLLIKQILRNAPALLNAIKDFIKSDAEK